MNSSSQKPLAVPVKMDTEEDRMDRKARFALRQAALAANQDTLNAIDKVQAQLKVVRRKRFQVADGSREALILEAEANGLDRQMEELSEEFKRTLEDLQRLVMGYTNG